MTKTSDAKTEPKISNDVSEERLERIRQRAYELYQARGGGEGYDFDDWLQAEAEIAARETAKQKA